MPKFAMVNVTKAKYMAKDNQIRRMALIVNKLRGSRTPVRVQELVAYVERSMRERFSDTAGCSLRTLQRDFKSIEELFGFKIRYDKLHEGYYMAGTEEESAIDYEALLLNFELLSAIDADSTVQKYVLAEHRRPKFDVSVSELLDAIRQCHPVEFDYELFRHGNQVVRKRLNPHFLKESQGRWYAVGYDVPWDRLDAGREAQYPQGRETSASGLKIKTFAIDRMSALRVVEAEKFRRNNAIDIPALFRECYGIWNNIRDPVEGIVLRYDSLDGSFVRSLPLHPSQETETEADGHVVVRLKLRITNDFVMALLARSRSLEVLEPLSLRKRLHDVYQQALERNRI